MPYTSQLATSTQIVASTAGDTLSTILVIIGSILGFLALLAGLGMIFVELFETPIKELGNEEMKRSKKLLGIN